jgi:hypothetical protein
MNPRDLQCPTSASRGRKRVPGPHAGQSRHELPGAALAHAKQLLDGLPVEVSGFHTAQGFQDFVKPVKPRRLGRHTHFDG